MSDHRLQGGGRSLNPYRKFKELYIQNSTGFRKFPNKYLWVKPY